METTTKGYGTTWAVCAECGGVLEKARARVDGEATFVGYHPCPKHPRAGARYESGARRESV